MLPELWPETREVKLSDAFHYFRGGHVVKVQREGYEEPATIPKAERDVVETAVSAAVESGKLWLLSGTASIMAEPIPAGILTEAAQLLPPPPQTPAMDVLPPNLPDAWKDGQATALGISVTLSQKSGKTLPWATVREAIDGAIRARMLEKTEDSGAWPCDLSGAQVAKFKVPAGQTVPIPGATTPTAQVPQRVHVAGAELRPNEIQDLADVIGDVVGAAVGHDLKFKMRIELGGETPPYDELVEKLNKTLRGVHGDMQLR